MNVSTVFAIQTQGRGDGSESWVKTYYVEYSQDCNTFTSQLDVDGTTQVRNFVVFSYINLQHALNIKHYTWHTYTHILTFVIDFLTINLF